MAGSQNGEIGLLRRLKEAIPSIRLVALLDGAVDSEMLRLLHLADVDAVLTEDISAEVLERTLDMVMLGQGVFPASMRRLLTVARPSVEELPAAPPPLPPAMASPPPPPVPVEEPLPAPAHPAEGHRAEDHQADEQRPVALSLREEQVLYCLAKGFPNKLIARKLCLSEATVKVHVKGLLRKIQVANRTQAAIWAHGSYFKADSIAGVSGLD
ncbi:MAG: response regulator transcription factor [Geminicoccaceae bacterium]